MRSLYYKNETDGTQGVRYHVNQIIGEACTDLHAAFHPDLLMRLPIFPFAWYEDEAPNHYELPEAGVYEVIAEYWSGTPEQLVRRVYFYYACRCDGTLVEVQPGDTLLDEVNAAPYFRAVEHLDGSHGMCWWEVEPLAAVV